MSACRLEKISLSYHAAGREVRALDNISLKFAKGTFWAILGSSGAGKSSLLNLLGCLDRPSKGTYYIDDQRVDFLNDYRLSETRLRKIGFIFQGFHLIPQLTVKENIELPMLYLGLDRKVLSKRTLELAEQLGLTNRLNHRPRELSGGQQQRVAIGRAMANNPCILLADEPTGNLDSATSQRIMKVLASLHEQGTTVLMVTHEPELAQWAQKKLYLRDGQVERITT